MHEEGISIGQYFTRNRGLFPFAGDFENPKQVGPEVILLEEDLVAQRISDTLVDSLMVSSSSICGIEHLRELSLKAKGGASCLILLEHYSNADYPCFHGLLRRFGEGEIANKLVAMAGVKLYEESSLTNFMVRAYRSLFIYPSRSISHLGGSAEDQLEKERSAKINMASLRKLMEIKRQDNIVALFPTGTRYRPGRPGTKEVLREVASYLKQFEYCVFVGINGNILRITGENMEEDRMVKDIMVFSVSSVTSTSSFIEKVLSTLKGEGPDHRKDLICQAVSRELDRMHGIGLEIYNAKSKASVFG